MDWVLYHRLSITCTIIKGLNLMFSYRFVKVSHLRSLQRNTAIQKPKTNGLRSVEMCQWVPIESSSGTDYPIFL